ncbi:MAG: hypothetical protein JWL85_523 [Candidatus Saccharibacteria bacterium]|nr:hypothetical protein [Candidatus Saccharibacteria bacterium]
MWTEAALSGAARVEAGHTSEMLAQTDTNPAEFYRAVSAGGGRLATETALEGVQIEAVTRQDRQDQPREYSLEGF